MAAGKPPTDAECEETLRLYTEHGSTKAAEIVGISPRSFRDRVSEAKRRKSGMIVTGRSTLTNLQTGEPVMEWVKESLGKDAIRAEFLAFVEEASKPLKGIAPHIPRPKATDTDLLAVYPIGDHHYGMKADPNETGDAYDCKIATRRLTAAIDYLTASAPPAKEALLLNLGDYFHANDRSNQTPASGNLMDVDTRFGQVFDTGAMALIHCVLRLLEKHQVVHIWNMRGNHDPDAAQALAVAMAFYFHNEPRVIVDRGTSLYKFMRFGKNLIASHHGHGTKPENLPLLMAVDRQKDWAATEHRVWHVGHFHHKAMKEHPGCDVEVHRTLAGTDAWHAGKGYRSKRDMQVIIYHRELGESQRIRFDPAILKLAA